MDKNTIMQLVAQIGTGPVANFIMDSGYNDIDSYLASREPKQTATQVPLGSGDGTSPSQIEHYINVSKPC
jgi:hypothetical protein